MGKLEDQIKALQEENARLKAQGTKPLSLKVGEKGGVSMYGLGRFPVTLYKEQWARLLEHADEIRKFIADNEASLKSKGDANRGDGA